MDTEAECLLFASRVSNKCNALFALLANANYKWWLCRMFRRDPDILGNTGQQCRKQRVVGLADGLVFHNATGYRSAGSTEKFAPQKTAGTKTN